MAVQEIHLQPVRVLQTKPLVVGEEQEKLEAMLLGMLEAKVAMDLLTYFVQAQTKLVQVAVEVEYEIQELQPQVEQEAEVLVVVKVTLMEKMQPQILVQAEAEAEQTLGLLLEHQVVATERTASSLFATKSHRVYRRQIWANM
jgi:hypothetical protein